MDALAPAVLTAFWLGILTAISPCPLTTNIAAISFIGRKTGSIPFVLGSGLLYTLGRMLAYASLGCLIVQGLLAAPALSHGLQKYMTLLMGPLLILIAMVLLKLLVPPSFPNGVNARLQHVAGSSGLLGAGLLGIVFALAFCPVSAALFFGSLIPLAIKCRAGILLPTVYAVATSLPVLVFAFLLAFSANRLGKAFRAVAAFEKWAQRVTGILFLAAGLWMTLSITLQLF